MTNFSNLSGRVLEQSTVPTAPQAGDEFFDTDTNLWMRFDGVIWRGIAMTSSTSTSTSSSTTSTSSSTSSTTSTSSSSSTTSTSTSSTSTSTSSTSTSTSSSTTV